MKTKIFVIVGLLVLFGLAAVFYFSDSSLFQGRLKLNDKGVNELEAPTTVLLDLKFKETIPIHFSGNLTEPKYTYINPRFGVVLTAENVNWEEFKKYNYSIWTKVDFFVDNKFIKTVKIPIKFKNSGISGSNGADYNSFRIDELSGTGLDTACKPHEFVAVIDPQNEYPESNEDNNKASFVFTIFEDGTAKKGDVYCENLSLTEKQRVGTDDIKLKNEVEPGSVELLDAVEPGIESIKF
ncbi:hypothetical protein HY604_03030 [Candidatus Peregrinibacteria bacterium]|nr:hypothetical protein [Candidatus Peregrinibacteria bacterium]